MQRTLNPNYFDSLSAQHRIPQFAALQFMSWRMGATRDNEFLVNKADGYSAADWQQYLSSKNYAGWSKPGSLYCTRAGHRLDGVPRQIFAANWCQDCHNRLSSRDDSEKDAVGYDIYRRFVTEATQLAVDRYRQHIRGGSLILKRGMTAGFHKDHCLSVRRAFELQLPIAQVSSPVNISVIPSAENLTKRAACTLGKQELADMHASFLAIVPDWDDQVGRLFSVTLE